MATYTKQPARMQRIIIEVPMNALPTDPQMVLATFVEDFVNDADPLDIEPGEQQPINFNAHDPVIAAQPVTADGATVTYAQLIELIKQAVLDQLP